MLASSVWLVCIAVTLIGAVSNGVSFRTLWPYGLAASVPALIGLMLYPKLRTEWAQTIVVFSWLALATLGCLAVSYNPMVALFLCVPAVAALFEKERVVEGSFLALGMSILLYFATKNEAFSTFHITTPEQSEWAMKAALVSTTAFLVATMYGAADTSAGNAKISESQVEILNSVPSSLMRVSPQNFVSIATDVSGNLFDIPKDNLPLSAPVLFEPKQARDKFRKLLDAARKRGAAVQANFRLSRDESDPKATRHVQVTATPIHGGDVMVHTYDVTPMANEIKQLRSASRSAAGDARNMALFFSGVSHELRTPLNAIIGFSDMMRSRLFGPLPNKYAEYADMIHDSGQHMLDLIGDVLDISKIEVGKYDIHYDTFDAAEVIRSSVKMMRPAAESAGIKLETEIISPSGELKVSADRKALRQVILNLLSNAVKFTPKGGHIKVTGQIRDNNLIVEVKDDGVGVGPDELALMGQPFTQTQSGRDSDARGSGLGLSLVRSLAELHGGRMDIQSGLGKGTRVTITIPRSQ